MVDRGPTWGVGTVRGIVALNNGVHDMFDQVKVIDRGRLAVLVSAFERVVKHFVELAIQHRGFAGVLSEVDVLIGGGFRGSVRGGGLPGDGPFALGVFARM